MFDSILGTLTQHRRATAAYLEPMAPAPEPVPTDVPKVTDAATARPDAPSAARAPRAPPALTYVRILKSGRPLEVGAETIDLREDDVLSLPPDAAKLLIDAKVAEPIATGPNRPVT